MNSPRIISSKPLAVITSSSTEKRDSSAPWFQSTAAHGYGCVWERFITCFLLVWKRKMKGEAGISVIARDREKVWETGGWGIEYDYYAHSKR